MSFESQAAVYHEKATIQRDLIVWGRPLMPRSLEGQGILELGAGTGLFTEELLKLSPKRLLATDISLAMIAQGKENVPEADWQLADAWNLELKGKRFDWIVSSSLLQWCPDPVFALETWKRHLTSGGRVLALFYVSPTLEELYRELPSLNYITWRTPEVWVELFETTGFKCVLAQQKLKHYYYETGQAAIRFLNDTGTKYPVKLSSREIMRAIAALNAKREADQGVPMSWNFFGVVLTL